MKLVGYTYLLWSPDSWKQEKLEEVDMVELMEDSKGFSDWLIGLQRANGQKPNCVQDNAAIVVQECRCKL